MDPNSTKLSESMGNFKVDNETLLPFSSQDLSFQNGSSLSTVPSPDLSFLYDSIPIIPTNPDPITETSGNSSGLYSSWNTAGEASSPSDDSDSSDPVLRYISQMLLEENMDEQPCMFYNPLALQATEQSLYDVISHSQQFHGSNNSNIAITSSNSSTVDSNFSDIYQWLGDLGEDKLKNQSLIQTRQMGDRGLMVSSVNELLAQNMFSNKDSMLQFKRGLEEGSKFLPSGNQLGIDLEKHERVNSPEGLRGKKNYKRGDDGNVDLEEARSSKHSAVYVEESDELSEMFDKVLLLKFDSEGKPLKCSESYNVEGSKPSGDLNISNNDGRKSRSRKGKKDNEAVDFRSLLILCAQAVSSNDVRTANELLRQIREYASDTGDGSQRLAHVFANGLEARLAGSQAGTKNFFASLFPKTTAADILKAYKVHLSTCPFKKMAILFANKMIMNISEEAKTLHVIDFGILYGFQWPILIQLLSMRPGGPPKLKITGIEIPQPGFRPEQRIAETGRRLAKYCERFNVPFEYNGVASQHWETIRIEELKIHSNEVVAVNCMYRFKNLLDETAEVDCPRDTVLKLIRKINPAIFVHSLVNGSYNAPFFVTRFREAIFHFSSLYDMFDATLPRDDQERMMLEREIYGREVMNVIACEGLQRVERPESYKQWQVRCIRAGFQQIPLDRNVMKKLDAKMKEWYNKNFVIDEDGYWLLQGWKGRIICASSCWVPA